MWLQVSSESDVGKTQGNVAAVSGSLVKIDLEGCKVIWPHTNCISSIMALFVTIKSGPSMSNISHGKHS